MTMSSDKNRTAIASRLKSAREQAGLTQAEVANVLGLHRPAISEMESGRRSVSAEELVLLARAYDVNVTWLLDTQEFDPVRDRAELAVQVLGKLPREDLERLLVALRALLSRQESKPAAGRAKAKVSRSRSHG